MRIFLLRYNSYENLSIERFKMILKKVSVIPGDIVQFFGQPDRVAFYRTYTTNNKGMRYGYFRQFNPVSGTTFIHPHLRNVYHGKQLFLYLRGRKTYESYFKSSKQ